MSYATVIVALLGLCGFALVQGETTSAVLEHQWSSGFKMNIRLQLLEKVTGGWTMTLRFTKPSPGLQIWRAKIVSVSSDKKVYELTNMQWNLDLPKCKVFKLALLADKTLQGTPAPTATVEFKRKRGDNTNLNEAACTTTPSPSPPPPTTTTPSPCTTPKPTTKTASPSSSLYGETTSAVLEHQWPWGFKMNIRLQLLEKVTGGWTMTLRFTKPSPGLLIWRAKIVSVSSDEKVYKLENMPWNRDLPKCKVFELAFRANKTLQGTPAPNATVEFSRKKGDNTNLNEAACATTPSPTPTTTPSPCTTPKPTTKTASPSSSLYGETTSAVLEHQWPWGFKMNIRLQLLDEVTGGWTMTLRFTKPSPGLLIWRAKIVSVSSDEKVYKLENMPWNRDLPKCKVFELAFRANKTPQGTPAPTANVEFSRKKGDNTNLNEAACTTTPSPPTTTSP